MKTRPLIPLSHLENVFRIHLAILNEPYLTLTLDKIKLVETRFSMNKGAPYGIVSPGDKILLKLSGGKILGEAYASKVLFLELTPIKFDILVVKYANEIRATKEYLESKRSSKYATLIWLTRVARLPTPITFQKRDQRAWLVLKYDPTNVQCEDCVHFLDDEEDDESGECIEKCEIREGTPLPCEDWEEG